MKHSQKSAQTAGTFKKYWQSLEEKQDLALTDWERPEFPERPETSAKSGFSRRDFLKFMGAGAVMATAACRRPTEQIVPAVKAPPEQVPGLPTFYSSTTPGGSGIVVRTRDGRPVKIAGNPDHPLTHGGVTASEVASIMDLYDPDRLRKPVVFEEKNGKRRKQVSTDSAIVSAATAKLASGESYLLFTGPVDSPSTRSLVADFLRKYPGGRHVEFRPDPALRQIAEGQRESYGQDLVPNYRFDRADLVVSIDGDFLGTLIHPAYFSHAFTSKRDLRKSKKSINRLVAFESMFTLTGSNADERYGIRPGDQTLIALAIASYLIVEQRRSNLAGNAAVRSLLQQYRPETIANALKQESGLYRKGHFEEVIARVADELWNHRGRSLVIGGSPLAATGNNAAAQIAVNLLNSILGNDGVTVAYGQPLQYSTGISDRELQAVIGDIGKRYKTIILAANPVYHLPQNLNAHAALAKADYVLALSDRLDESAQLADAVLPLSHWLEAWGDSEVIAGVHGIRQPVIRPLYNTLSLEDRLIQLAGGNLGGQSTFHDYVKNRWRGLAGGKNFRKFWVSVLQAGYYAPGRSALKGSRPARTFRPGALGRLPQFSSASGPETDSGKLVLGLYYNVQVLDGSGANNAYRQELPDPVTKIVWDNYVAMLPATARSLGLQQGSMVELTTKSGAKMKLPVHLQPGLHPQAALVALGYGREAAGKIGDGVGKKALDMVVIGSDSLAFSGDVVEVKAAGGRHTLASTQTIYRQGFNDQSKRNLPGTPEGAHEVPFAGSSLYTGMRDGKHQQRPIVRETTWSEYKTGKFELQPPALYYPKGAELMPEWNYKDTRWHMVIDLNACTGCGACVTSCNNENNIPMVGRDQVARGREMHWLRIDRYFVTTAEESLDQDEIEEAPVIAHQPMLCQHCENAPCENVCPVAATTHNHEGLNVMTYNRCVGTRYCANNCPYKVRRFNWYENWNYMEGLWRGIRDPQHLAMNPDVTVRTRGVIEKCMFCIQRIAVARQESKARGESYVPDGSVVTACQEVCPTGGISFGNILDPDSDVQKLKKKEEQRSFQVLDFLGVKPSITYLARVRNKGQS